jgi:hypothetical protein
LMQVGGSILGLICRDKSVADIGAFHADQQLASTTYQIPTVSKCEC